jgi:hypothetical protein
MGPDSINENTISAIEDCVSQGFDVEIDVWAIDKKLWLGHDKRLNSIKQEYLELRRDKLWIHAKNKAAARLLVKTDLHWFWHERDTLTLTSKNFIWCHYTFIEGAITILHHKDEISGVPPKAGGICTDYPVLAAQILGDDNGS